MDMRKQANAASLGERPGENTDSLPFIASRRSWAQSDMQGKTRPLYGFRLRC